MNELRFMGTSAVTPVGLFALGGNGKIVKCFTFTLSKLASIDFLLNKGS